MKSMDLLKLLGCFRWVHSMKLCFILIEFHLIKCFFTLYFMSSVTNIGNVTIILLSSPQIDKVELFAGLPVVHHMLWKCSCFHFYFQFRSWNHVPPEAEGFLLYFLSGLSPTVGAQDDIINSRTLVCVWVWFIRSTIIQAPSLQRQYEEENPFCSLLIFWSKQRLHLYSYVFVSGILSISSSFQNKEKFVWWLWWCRCVMTGDSVPIKRWFVIRIEKYWIVWKWAKRC